MECPEHRVRQVTVPWAQAECGFTLMFEAFVMALAREMPVRAVGQLVGEHDTRLWRVVRHYVAAAHERQDWGGVQAVAIDETATRKGHRYATVVVEMDPDKEQPARLLFMTPERSAASVGEFVEAMAAHGAHAGQVKLAGNALDEVRKQLAREGADVKGALWALRGNESRLGEEPLRLRQNLCARHKGLGRAMALRENLQDTWAWPGAASAGFHLKAWCSWAVRSRLAPFKKLAHTIKKHWEGILAYFPHRITSAAIESINGIIQTARRRARGFRNFENLKAISYWMAGHLDLQIPSAFTHPI